MSCLVHVNDEARIIEWMALIITRAFRDNYQLCRIIIIFWGLQVRISRIFHARRQKNFYFTNKVMLRTSGVALFSS